LEYVRNALRGRSLVVDLCGTGWSLGILRERAQVDFDILVVHDIGGGNYHTGLLEIQNPARPQKTWSIVGREHFIDNRVLECCNYAPHQSIVDVYWNFKMRNGVPVFDHRIYTPAIEAAVFWMGKAFSSSIQKLKTQGMKKLFNCPRINLTRTSKKILKIYTLMAERNEVLTDLISYHAEDDGQVLSALRELSTLDTATTDCPPSYLSTVKSIDHWIESIFY
jgi:hypothetical protein